MNRKLFSRIEIGQAAGAMEAKRLVREFICGGQLVAMLFYRTG
jgi:hypothetical protein